MAYIKLCLTTNNMDNVILRELKACGNRYTVYFDGIINSKNRNRAAILIKNLI